jgi:hypothetical protein
VQALATVGCAAMSEFDDFVARVEHVTGRQGRRVGGETRLLCPAHDDHHPSLDVSEGDGGRPLATCRSQGCSWEAISEAIGWNGSRPSSSDPVAVFTYTDEQGKPLIEVGRFERDDGKTFLQRRAGAADWKGGIKGVRRVLYRLAEVVAAVADGRAIWITEGEKHADLLRSRGRIATSAPMGAGKWHLVESDALTGAARVFVIADDDEAGRVHADDVARSLLGRVGEVKVVKLWPDGETKRDLIDFYAAAATPEEADRELVAIVERTPAFGNGSEPLRTVVSEAGSRGWEGEADGIGLTAPALKEAVSPRQIPSRESGSDLRAVSDAPSRPFAMPVAEFVAVERPHAEPLLADDDGRAVVARCSLTLCGALGGHGKTTLFVDLALHLAAGIDYPPFTVPTAASILLIENEGPEELFAEKLAARLASFEHELRARLDVCTFDWGSFSLADDEARQQLAAAIADKGYDLVFGDPLDSLGIEGVGSPEDTRGFMALMKQTGLHKTVAWWLNTHPRKEETKEALNEIAGAWGGKPDTVLLLRRLEDDRTQVRFPKLRHTKRGTRPTILLAFDAETEAFTFIGEASEEKRDYLAEIVAHVREHPWQTNKEIGAPVEKGGIGANPDTVKQQLEEHPDVFESRTGDGAVALGRKANAVLWALAVSFAEIAEANRSLTEQTGSHMHQLSDAIAEARRLRGEEDEVGDQ